MTESYSPFSDLEEITALPTEFVSTASSSTRDTVTDWGNHASTEITDPLLGFSEEQQPPTEANSGGTDRGGTDTGGTDRGGTDTGGTDRVSTATLSGHTSQAGTYQSETGAPTSSEKPVHSTEDRVADTSGPGRESATTSVTESSTGPFGPPALDHTQDAQPHTQEDDPGQAFSTAPPEADGRTTVTDNPSTALPFTPETERPAETTEVLATTLTTTTERTQFAEGDTFRATTGFFTTMPGSTTPPYQPGTSAEPSTTPTTATTTATTTTPATAAQTTPEPEAPPSTTQRLPPSRTSGTAAHTSASDGLVATDVSTLHLETSTATPGNGYTTVSYSSTAPSQATPAHTSGNRTHGVTPPHTSGSHTHGVTPPHTTGNHTHGVTPAQTTGKHTHGVTPAQTTGKHTQRASTTAQTTTVRTRIKSTVTPESPCSWSPCRNGGTCVPEAGEGHGCVCLPSWTGPDCDEDMDECVSGPCPLGSQCVNTRGSFSCVCPLGSDLEHGRACTRARTFLGTFHLSNVPPNATHPRSLVLHELQREILQLLNASLSTLKGYSRSTLNKSDGSGMQVSAVHTFAMSAEVTSDVVTKSIETFLESCSQAVGPCRVALHHALLYKAESLCVAMGTQCDLERTNCTDTDGTTSCQCRAGYFKHSTEDLTCRECEEGFKLENGTCVRCMFGFGGFNCGNFYKLITVVVAPAGGVILLILIIALIVTCCKKDKNDISKIIFKSGDFQMSPYAEYPKNNRVSMEWGRETIEMQENGSTKNLLQMTDIYYSPALRNPELDRSGLYPFSGMPGSRHSCIYPAQWNPSFISDDTRRRDYF
ncbi:protein HEG [Conger conger]|uniref:protein HEG n=1 Tax=Conger conger TaxID=82655 RepID=UPI002A5AD334|nr:protein HEG [Conger conger]